MNESYWRVEETSAGGRSQLHVIPIDDERKHYVNGLCPCHPAWEYGMYKHKAWDRREVIEEVES